MRRFENWETNHDPGRDERKDEHRKRCNSINKASAFSFIRMRGLQRQETPAAFEPTPSSKKERTIDQHLALEVASNSATSEQQRMHSITARRSDEPFSALLKR